MSAFKFVFGIPDTRIYIQGVDAVSSQQPSLILDSIKIPCYLAGQLSLVVNVVRLS